MKEVTTYVPAYFPQQESRDQQVALVPIVLQSPVPVKKKSRRIRTVHHHRKERFMEPAQKIERKQRRHHRAIEGATCFMFFVSSFIPCGFGWAGLTVFLWGVLASYIFYRLIK
jgi:hypothetical protein